MATTLETIIDDLIAEKQIVQAQRGTTRTQLEAARAQLITALQDNIASRDSIADILVTIEGLDQTMKDLDYAERQYDDKLQSARDLLST